MDLFKLGVCVCTPAALELLESLEKTPHDLITRHVTGDFGDLDDEDLAQNCLAIEQGYQVFSDYHLAAGARVYVITEGDRSCTTVFLPSDY
jgi:hypothetical protein